MRKRKEGGKQRACQLREHLLSMYKHAFKLQHQKLFLKWIIYIHIYIHTHTDRQIDLEAREKVQSVKRLLQ